MSFSMDMIIYKVIIKDKPCLWDIIKQWRKNDIYCLVTTVSNCVILVQFMDSYGKTSHAFTEIDVWIFGTNYKNHYY